MARKRVRIIALLGSAASGKSTVAEHLVRNHGFIRVRFAAPLKDMLVAAGLTREQVDGPQTVKNTPCELLLGRTPRHAMQTLGTAWRDTIGKRLWSRITRLRIADIAASLAHTEKTVNIVIDDMRFLHEPRDLEHPDWQLTVLAIRRSCVEPTRVERTLAYAPLPMIVRRMMHIAFGIRPLHRSEAEWFKIKRDFDIDNNGSLSALLDQINKSIRFVRN